MYGVLHSSCHNPPKHLCMAWPELTWEMFNYNRVIWLIGSDFSSKSIFSAWLTLISQCKVTLGLIRPKVFIYDVCVHACVWKCLCWWCVRKYICWWFWVKYVLSVISVSRFQLKCTDQKLPAIFWFLQFILQSAKKRDAW